MNQELNGQGAGFSGFLDKHPVIKKALLFTSVATGIGLGSVVLEKKMVNSNSLKSNVGVSGDLVPGSNENFQDKQLKETDNETSDVISNPDGTKTKVTKTFDQDGTLKMVTKETNNDKTGESMVVFTAPTTEGPVSVGTIDNGDGTSTTSSYVDNGDGTSDMIFVTSPTVKN